MPAFASERWRALSPHLDKALEISTEQRLAWLEIVREQNPSVATDLQALLQEHEALRGEGFLKTDVRRGPGEDAVRPGPSPLTGQQVGAYALESPIGQGGMGTVWLARRSDGRFEGRAAVKFLNTGLLGGGAEQRFKREGSILARLAHPHIAHLIDAGVSPNGQPYLILEYIEGKNIDAYCNEQALDIDARIQLFLDVLAAVAHAHANLIVHRDVKPSNVLVTDDGQVKLLDFGIAKLLEDETSTSAATVLTRQGERALTLAYAAPEQVTGSAITTGTDVYALGVLLYQLLTGTHPAESALQSPADLMRAIVDTQPPRPSDALGPARNVSRELRGDLDTIVGKALKKNPAERYASATAFADDLRRYIRHEPISARPDTLAYRAKKFIRRNQLAVALSAAGLIAVIAGVIGTAIQARTARRERDFATHQLARAQAINDFNSIVLTDAAPWGKPVTIGDLLTRAEQLIERRSDMDSTKRAELLMSVASQYTWHEQYGPAHRLMEQAARLARASPDPSTRARAFCALAEAIGGSDIPTAESLVQAGLNEIPDARFALDRVYCLKQGTYSAFSSGHIAEALARAEVAQRALQQAPFRPAMLELENLRMLAMSYDWSKRKREAIASYEQAAELIRTQGLGDTQLAGEVFGEWGFMLNGMGRPLEAEPLINRAIQIGRRGQAGEVKLPPNSLRYYTSLLLALARFDDAATYAERLQAQAQANPDVIWALHARVRIYSRLGNLERASQMVSELEERVPKQLRPGHERSFSYLAHSKALLAMARGDKLTALDFANQAITIQQQSAMKDLGSVLPYLQNLLVMRSEIQLALGRVEEAISDAERALSILAEDTPPEMLSTRFGNAYLALGRALQAQGKREEAQTAFRSAVKHLESALGPDHADTQAARHLADGVVQPQ